MTIQPEAALTENEPVFLEALAAAAKCSPDEAATRYRDVSEITDLHRVETFLEQTASAG